MTREKPVVIVTRKLPDVIETRMMELFDTRLNRDDKPMTQAELIQAAKTADVLVPTVTDRIDKAAAEWAAAAKLDPSTAIGRRSQSFVDLLNGRQTSAPADEQ